MGWEVARGAERIRGDRELIEASHSGDDSRRTKMLNRPFICQAGDTKITTEFRITDSRKVEAVRLETVPEVPQHNPNTRPYLIGKQTCLLFGLG
jgi:hypothetical protein